MKNLHAVLRTLIDDLNEGHTGACSLGGTRVSAIGRTPGKESIMPKKTDGLVGGKVGGVARV